MAAWINFITFFGTFLVFLTGNGSGLRMVAQPQPFTDLTNEINISCIADEPAYLAKSIISIQIIRHIEDEPIAVVNLKQEVKMAVGIKDNVKAQGHIDSKTNKSYLTLIINKPDRQDAGTYRCQMFFLDDNSQLVEKNVIGNVIHLERNITRDITHLYQKASRLSTTVLKLNNTQQAHKKQHISFIDFHSQQKFDMDILTDKVGMENMTNTEQNKELMELKDHQSRQKQDIDILIDNMNRQTKTNIELTNQIVLLNKDNTKKQKQLDTLIAYVEQQKETNQKYELQLQFMVKQIVILDPEWKYYEADKTFNKAFGKDDETKKLSWSKARESCQTFGGDLVQIHDADKNMFVVDLFDGAPNGHPWIGLRNTARRGLSFKYVDGSDLGSYHPWYRRQPNGDLDDDDDCVVQYTHASNPGKWLDYSCSDTNTYVCSVSS